MRAYIKRRQMAQDIKDIKYEGRKIAAIADDIDEILREQKRLDNDCYWNEFYWGDLLEDAFKTIQGCRMAIDVSERSLRKALSTHLFDDFNVDIDELVAKAKDIDRFPRYLEEEYINE